MVGLVTYGSADFAPVPDRFEAGLQNYGGIFGTKAAIEYLSKVGMDEIEAYDHRLMKYMFDRTKDIKGLHIIGPEDPMKRSAVMSFNIDGLGAHDVAMMLDAMDGIMVRSGMHCAHPFFVSREIEGSVRASRRSRRPAVDSEKPPEGVKGCHLVLSPSPSRTRTISSP